MKKYGLIYTPERHIPMAAPIVSPDGDVMLSFKKASEPVYEEIRLDEFLKRVYAAIENQTVQAAQARQPQNP